MWLSFGSTAYGAKPRTWRLIDAKFAPLFFNRRIADPSGFFLQARRRTDGATERG